MELSLSLEELIVAIGLAYISLGIMCICIGMAKRTYDRP